MPTNAASEQEKGSGQCWAKIRPWLIRTGLVLAVFFIGWYGHYLWVGGTFRMNPGHSGTVADLVMAISNILMVGVTVYIARIGATLSNSLRKKENEAAIRRKVIGFAKTNRFVPSGLYAPILALSKGQSVYVEDLCAERMEVMRVLGNFSQEYMETVIADETGFEFYEARERFISVCERALAMPEEDATTQGEAQKMSRRRHLHIGEVSTIVDVAKKWVRTCESIGIAPAPLSSELIKKVDEKQKHIPPEYVAALDSIVATPAKDHSPASDTATPAKGTPGAPDG